MFQHQLDRIINGGIRRNRKQIRTHDIFSDDRREVIAVKSKQVRLGDNATCIKTFVNYHQSRNIVIERESFFQKPQKSYQKNSISAETHRQIAEMESRQPPANQPVNEKAGERIRTVDVQLGKLAFYH